MTLSYPDPKKRSKATTRSSKKLTARKPSKHRSLEQAVDKLRLYLESDGVIVGQLQRDVQELKNAEYLAREVDAELARRLDALETAVRIEGTSVKASKFAPAAKPTANPTPLLDAEYVLTEINTESSAWGCQQGSNMTLKMNLVVKAHGADTIVGGSAGFTFIYDPATYERLRGAWPTASKKTYRVTITEMNDIP